MFKITIYYEDNPIPFEYDGVNKIGYWSATGFITKQGDEILSHHFYPKYDLVLYSNTFCVTVASKNIRCIEIAKD